MNFNDFSFKLYLKIMSVRDKIFSGIAQWLISKKITANQISIFRLFFVVPLFIFVGYAPIVAILILVLNYFVLDAIDGVVARKTKSLHINDIDKSSKHVGRFCGMNQTTRCSACYSEAMHDRDIHKIKSSYMNVRQKPINTGQNALFGRALDVSIDHFYIVPFVLAIIYFGLSDAFFSALYLIMQIINHFTQYLRFGIEVGKFPFSFEKFFVYSAFVIYVFWSVNILVFVFATFGILLLVKNIFSVFNLYYGK